MVIHEMLLQKKKKKNSWQLKQTKEEGQETPLILLQSLSRSPINAKLNECTWPNKYSSLKRKHVNETKYLIIPNNVH